MWPKIRHWENIHIPLWLMKDTCWMLEWKVFGICMICPTLFVAIFITWKTRLEDEFFINLAICFWISANAYWMCCEFFHHVEIKDYAGYPFLAGMLSVSWFYYKRLTVKGEEKNIL
jgi:hypothetical protein